MDIAKSDLVLATAGREKGRLFFVVDVQNEYLLLADGKSRRLEAPKRKKCRHVQRAGAAPEELAAKLRMNFIRILPGDKVTVEMSPYDLTRGRITWRTK